MSKELDALKEVVKMMEEKEKEGKILLYTINPGEVILGKEGRKYIVLKQDQNQTMIISADLMAENEKFDDDSSDYKKSSLKRKIETDILPLIEEDFGAENIVEHEVSLITVDMQEDYGTLTCKVRPVTFDEAREFNDLLVNKELSDWYWACTPWSTEERGYGYSNVVVSPQGLIDWNDSNYRNGVRPFCILKSNIFVSKEA